MRRSCSNHAVVQWFSTKHAVVQWFSIDLQWSLNVTSYRFTDMSSSSIPRPPPCEAKGMTLDDPAWQWRQTSQLETTKNGTNLNAKARPKMIRAPLYKAMAFNYCFKMFQNNRNCQKTKTFGIKIPPCLFFTAWLSDTATPSTWQTGPTSWCVAVYWMDINGVSKLI